MLETIRNDLKPWSAQKAAKPRNPARASFGQPATLALLCAGVICVGVAGPASARSARDTFDGAWSVVITTQSGTCDPNFRYGVQISNGQVFNNGSSNVGVQGRVNRNGMVQVNVQSGNQWANGSGRLDPTRGGSGVWEGQGGVGACSGTWVAQRSGTGQTAGAEEPGRPLYNFAPGPMGQRPVAEQPAQSAVQNAVAACTARYHSYDAASGTYLNVDGMRHPCP